MEVRITKKQPKKTYQKIENNLPRKKKAKEDVMSKCVTGGDGKIVLHERARVMASCACVIIIIILFLDVIIFYSSSLLRFDVGVA